MSRKTDHFLWKYFWYVDRLEIYCEEINKTSLELDHTENRRVLPKFLVAENEVAFPSWKLKCVCRPRWRLMLSSCTIYCDTRHKILKMLNGFVQIWVRKGFTRDTLFVEHAPQLNFKLIVSMSYLVIRSFTHQGIPDPCLIFLSDYPIYIRAHLKFKMQGKIFAIKWLIDWSKNDLNPLNILVYF